MLVDILYMEYLGDDLNYNLFFIAVGYYPLSTMIDHY